MRRSWCWRPARAVLAAALAATVGGAAGTADAATVLDKRVSIELRADGSLHERTDLRVRLESAADVEAWEAYPIYLDDHRTLDEAEAWITHPGGERERVRRRHRDQVEASGDLLHSSQSFLLLQFPAPRVGSELTIGYSVDVAPYYPAGALALVTGDPVSRLTVEVRGGGAGFHWRLDGTLDGLEAEAIAGGVRITGNHLEPPEEPPYAPRAVPVLRYAWDGDAGWAGVGRWYRELLASLPRAAPAVRSEARRLAAGRTPRQALDVLTEHLQGQVRYVAVEVGIGGYRPSPPAEVLERRWGDCKDKALLLIDLLAESGVPAYPALVLADRDDRIDSEFPAPTEFNHLIVAVPETAVATGPGDPLAGGFLFVDPTLPRGGSHWLGPWVQGQDALVVLADGGRLVTTPERPELEYRELVVNVRLTPAGDAVGGAGLELRGARALGLLDQAANEPPERTEEDLRTIFAALLPGVELGALGWNPGEGPVPAIGLSAAISLPGMLQGTAGRASFRLPGVRSTPEPRLLDERSQPMVYGAGTSRVVWHVALPPGCRPPEEAEQRLDNAAGSFRQALTHRGDGAFTLERDTTLARRWVAGDLLGALAELSVAESRALRRRVRVECGAGPGR